MENKIKLVRLSADHKFEYQLEYELRGDGVVYYRIRRGVFGAWAEWFKTKDIHAFLVECGFKQTIKPSLLNDFFVEAYFSRGTIKLTDKMVREIMKDTGLNAMGRYIYSRLKNISSNTWALPSLAIDMDDHFEYVYNIIKNNL